MGNIKIEVLNGEGKYYSSISRKNTGQASVVYKGKKFPLFYSCVYEYYIKDDRIAAR